MIAGGATLEEIAATFAVSEDTVERAVLRSKGVRFCDYKRQVVNKEMTAFVRTFPGGKKGEGG